jgi:hypothetical protein
MTESPVRFSFTRPTLFFLSFFLLSWGDIAAADYWQQQVNYRMDITLQRDLRTINGSLEVEYINNSPDTLRVLYIKAFPNAIQKGSYADLKQRQEDDYSFTSLKPENEGRLVLSALPTSPKQVKKLVVDNTIITAELESPIFPHDTAELSFEFTTVLPSPRSMRMGLWRPITQASYWYPQICVYDRVLGWNNSQYLGWGECYGDYGNFDVHITAPEDQIVAATGVLANEDDVMPPDLRAKLDRANFAGPRSGRARLDFDSKRTKIWHYVAEKVNDFTFVSSADFCLDSGSANGVPIVVYVLRYHAKSWANTVTLAREVMETMSELYHPYQWPVMRVVDCASGMEYPMLVQIGGDGSSPGFHVVVYHEIAHNWFMGEVGSNQTDRPFLDEGFTTSAEIVVMEKYLGRKGNLDEFRTWYARTFAPEDEDRDERCFRPLMLTTKLGYGKPLVFSYDQGEEYYTYRVSAYYKTAAMHFALRSILGDSAYFKAMQDYCQTWFFRHPYEDDFKESMEKSTGLVLTPYMDQWYYSLKQLDYAYAGRKTEKTDEGFEHTITLANRGRFVSPIDVAVVFEQGDTTFYTIPPEGMEYAKPGYVLLPTWHQFRRFDEKYTFTVRAQRHIKHVIVDPFNLLTDVNRSNNRSGIPPVQLRFDNMKYDLTPVNQYALRLRPDLWYDEPNGLQIGFHSHGSYLEVDKQFSLDARVGTKSGRAIVDVKHQTPFPRNDPSLTFSQRYLLADHRLWYTTGYQYRRQPLYSRPDHEYLRFSFHVLQVGRQQDSRLDPLPTDIALYLPDPNWDAGWSANFSFNTGALKTFRYGNVSLWSTNQIGAYEDLGRHRSWTETRNLATLNLIHRYKTWLHARAEFLSQGGEPPSEYIYHLSKAQPLQTFVESQIFRSPGTYPAKWNDWFYLDGDRVRGYQNRNVYLMRSYAGSIELTPPDLLPYRWFRVLPLVGRFFSKADQSFFVDGAVITMFDKETDYRFPIAASETILDPGKNIFFMSAGVSISTPPVWSEQRVRVDFPIYLNKPISGEKKLAFRTSVAWVLPIQF